MAGYRAVGIVSASAVLLASVGNPFSIVMARLTFLFWNLQERERRESLAQLCIEHRVDILALAEPFEDGITLASHLPSTKRRPFRSIDIDNPGIQVFTSNHKIGLSEFQGFRGQRRSILEFQFGDEQFLLAVVHLRSKLWSDEHDQLHEAILLGQDIRQCEDAKQHRRSIVLGDLNMNPFESPVVSATGLHGFSTKDCVREESRVVQGVAYPFFYNPMWRFFGDMTEGPPGTYYYPSGGHSSALKWHLFDQVLLRPEVFPWWKDDVRILTSAGRVNLKDAKGRPDPQFGSDHFPILFRLHSRQ